MKKTLLFFALFFVAGLTLAQSDTSIVFTDIDYKTVKKEKADLILRAYRVDSTNYIFEKYNKNKVLLLKETYADPKLEVKQGAYYEYKHGKPVYKGNYIAGKREGLFLSYDTLLRVIETKYFKNDSANGPNVLYWSNGNKRQEGNYLNNTRVGLWTKYYKNGNVAIKETYSDRKIDIAEFKHLGKKERWAAFNKAQFLDSLFLDINGQPTTRDKVETEASYPGGINKFYQFLAHSIRYPSEAQKNSITGTVELSFCVDENGKVGDVKVERTPHPALAKEALRVLNLGAKWIPATFGGEKIRVKVNIPIKFSLG